MSIIDCMLTPIIRVAALDVEKWVSVEFDVGNSVDGWSEGINLAVGSLDGWVDGWVDGLVVGCELGSTVGLDVRREG
jgi:hypothetical protein